MMNNKQKWVSEPRDVFQITLACSRVAVKICLERECMRERAGGFFFWPQSFFNPFFKVLLSIYTRNPRRGLSKENQNNPHHVCTSGDELSMSWWWPDSVTPWRRPSINIRRVILDKFLQTNWHVSIRSPSKPHQSRSSKESRSEFFALPVRRHTKQRLRDERRHWKPAQSVNPLPVLISKICLWIKIIFYVMFVSLWRDRNECDEGKRAALQTL